MSPSYMIEDQLVHMDHVRTIEATMDEMKSQHEATHQLLQDVLTRLGPAQAQNVQDPLLTCPAHGSPTPSIPASSASQKKLTLKPSFPPDFSGDQAAGKAFLTSCRTYIRLCPEVFEDDLTKIIWAMLYMKTGRANRWATCEFEQEVKTGHLRFIDWLDFEEEFQKDFMPLDSEAAAINVLETTAYFQGKRTVDNHLNQFRDLIYDSRYTDLKTVVVKFCQGLNRRISTALAGMTYRRPSDTDPEAWFCLTVQMDQNRAADEVFHISHRQPYVLTPGMNRPLAISQPILAAPVVRFAHSNPSPGNPVPMDIDAARKTKATPDTCQHCGKTGHWAKECDLHFDVRYMDMDEIERELENKFATKDIASVETPDEAEPPVSVEDFVSCSG